MSGTLSIVATPIGNLGDITERALETLRTADVILAEDTRNTAKLLMHFGIETNVRSYHQHSSEREVNDILSLLVDGQHLALVTDAGTPGVSDPGNLLINSVITSEFLLSRDERGNPSDKKDQEIATSPSDPRNDVVVTPIPGPSALTAALSVSGFATDKFVFLGFPPHKNKRNKYFENVATQEHTVVFYESCHRIEKAMMQLSEVLRPDQQVCICRELTKKFESIYRGTMTEILEMDIPAKGEFVVVVSK